MKVEKIELPKELNEKTACEFIGRLASVCTGKEPATDTIAEKIGRMNLTEHLGTATRCWEMLPVILMNGRYNNFREGLHRGDSLKNLCDVYNKQRKIPTMFGDYFLFRIELPLYVYAHVDKHCMSNVRSSKRIGIDKEKLYEFPEVEIRMYRSDEYMAFRDNDGAFFFYNYTHDEFMVALERFYKRKEITKRSLSDFEVVDMVIGGYFNEGWDNFIKVRTASCDGTFVCPNPGCEKPCIQKETRELALIIKELIGCENA